MSGHSLVAALLVALAESVWCQVGPISAADPGFSISSEFGPRMLNGTPDFHPGIDYGAAVGTAAPLIEAGTITRLSFDGGGLNPTAGTILFFEFQTTATNHHFRYLHMFNNTALPINSGGFTLTQTNGGSLCIVHWVPGQVGVAADYALAATAGAGQFPLIGGQPVLNAQGASLATTDAAQSPVGPVGTSGGVAAHLHIDLGAGVSQNPLEYIAHAASNFTVQFLDGNGALRQNGFIVNPNDPTSSFIRVHLDTTQGKDAESLEVFVDNTSLAGLVRTWSYGGFTPALDALHTEISNHNGTANCPDPVNNPGCFDLDPPVFSDGVRNGVLPNGVGLRDFTFTDWQAAQTVVSPSNLSAGPHQLIACWTNILNQTNCTNQLGFTIGPRSSPPQVTMGDAGSSSSLYQNFSGIPSSSQPVPSSVVPWYYGGVRFQVNPGRDDQGKPIPIQSVTIGDSHGNTIAYDATTTDAPGQVAGVFPPQSVLALHPSMEPGVTYTLTATDIQGNKTVAPMKVVQISGNGSPTLNSWSISQSTFGVISYDFTWNIQATFPIAYAEQISVTPNVGTPGVKYQGAGQVPVPLHASGTGFSPANYWWNVYDTDGNSIRLIASVMQAPPLDAQGNPTRVIVEVAPGLSTGPVTGPYEGTEFEAGTYPPTELGFGVKASGLVFNQAGNIDVSFGGGKDPVLGYKTVPGPGTYWLTAGGSAPYDQSGTPPAAGTPLVQPGYSLEFDYPAGLSAGQTANLQIRTMVGTRFSDPISATVGANSVTITGGSLGVSPNFAALNYSLQVPVYQNPGFVKVGNATLLYNASTDPGVRMSAADLGTDLKAAALVAQAKGQGWDLQGPLYFVGPEGTRFNSPVYLTLPASSAGQIMGELSQSAAPLVPDNQYADYQTPQVTAQLASVNSYFGMFVIHSSSFVATSTATVGGNVELTVTSTVPATIVQVSTQTGSGLTAAAQQGLMLGGDVFQVAVASGASATATFAFDPAAVDTTTLAIGRFDGAAWSTMVVTMQMIGAGRVSGTIPPTGTYALLERNTVPPLVAFSFPGPRAVDLQQWVGGNLVVRGLASDLVPKSWSFSLAVGTAATTGFQKIVSGAGNVSGVLSVINAETVAGLFTLKLEATDRFGLTAVSTAPIFIGVPGLDTTISELASPQAVIARTDGSVWVSLDGTGQVMLRSSTGALVGITPASMNFSHPRGLALDTTGCLYVADRDHNRIAKLTPDGATLLLEFKNGLSLPNDATVDADGSVYVADAGNHRVRVFDAGGNVLRDIPLGASSQLWGVALSSAGLWVSDQAGQAISLLTRQGTIIKTFPEAGRVRGGGVDPFGALYVVRRSKDLIAKLDPQGAYLSAFGARSGVRLVDQAAQRYLSDPTDVSVAPDGSLWIVDAGHGRLARYTLPTQARGISRPISEGRDSGVVGPSPASVSRLLDARDGGAVMREDGTGVRVPPGAMDPALSLPLTVQDAAPGGDADARVQARATAGLAPASGEVQFGPEGTAFQKPVTLTLSYDPAQVAAQGLREDQLQIQYWNAGLRAWQALDSTVDTSARTISAQSPHFSIYQIMGSARAAAADAAFGLKAAYAFPNPTRGVSAVTIRVQPGLADGVEVHVYDVAGRQVHSSSDFVVRGAFDDGNGLGPQYTYDHVWDVSGVGSGVYTYVLTARRAGQADVRKTGRIGVVR